MDGPSDECPRCSRDRSKCACRSIHGSYGTYVYHRGEEIGRGAFGKVLRCSMEPVSGSGGSADRVSSATVPTGGEAGWRREGEVLAVKIFKFKKEKATEEVGDARDNFEKEAYLLSRLSHPNIVKGYDKCVEADRGAIVMEYVGGGTLKDQVLLSEGRPLEEGTVLTWIAQVAAALHYLHSVNLLHRDIKSENIMLTPDGIVKVVDFGTARLLTAASNMANTVVGTPHYMAPEVYYDPKPYDSKSDMWALGCVAYELLMRQLPFQAPTTFHIAQAVGEASHKPVDTRYSPAIRKLVDDLLEKDPSKRPSALDVLSLPLFCSQLSSMYNFWLSSLLPGFPALPLSDAMLNPFEANRIHTNVKIRARSTSDELLIDPPTPLRVSAAADSGHDYCPERERENDSHFNMHATNHIISESGMTPSSLPSLIGPSITVGDGPCTDEDEEEWFDSDYDETPESTPSQSPEMNGLEGYFNNFDMSPVGSPDVSSHVSHQAVQDFASKMVKRREKEREAARAVVNLSPSAYGLPAKPHGSAVTFSLKLGGGSEKKRGKALQSPSFNGRDRVSRERENSKDVLRHHSSEYNKMIKAAKPRVYTGVVGSLEVDSDASPSPAHLHRPPKHPAGTETPPRGKDKERDKETATPLMNAALRRVSVNDASPTASEASVDSNYSSESFRQQIKRDKMLAKQRRKDRISEETEGRAGGPFEVVTPRIFSDPLDSKGAQVLDVNAYRMEDESSVKNHIEIHLQIMQERQDQIRAAMVDK